MNVAPCTAAMPEHADNFKNYLLAELRCAGLRARLLQSDIDAIGIALKGGLITPDQALVLLYDCGALRVVGTPPDASKKR
jgi:hypothetical protein